MDQLIYDPFNSVWRVWVIPYTIILKKKKKMGLLGISRKKKKTKKKEEAQFQSRSPRSHQWSSLEPLLSHGPTPSLHIPQPYFVSTRISISFIFLVIISQFLSFAHAMPSSVF